MLCLVMAQRAVAKHLVVYIVWALDTMITNAYLIYLYMLQASKAIEHKKFRLQCRGVWH